MLFREVAFREVTSREITLPTLYSVLLLGVRGHETRDDSDYSVLVLEVKP
jgi:hypothetical protein